MRSFGVEEELLLVNADTGVPRAVAARAIAGVDDAGAEGGGSLGHELQRRQLETTTTPTTSADALAEDIRAWRRTAIDGARSAGARVIAAGTSPLPVSPRLESDPRYELLRERFALTTSEQLTCACHVHVSIESRDEGVAVLDRIRGITPVLVALSANSPFWQGIDSGYASFRSQVVQRWPTSGPQDVFDSVGAYDDLVNGMLRTGVMLDQGMVYFDARLSHRYPTVEVRVADVCANVRETVLIAILCRAVVETASRQWRAGEPAPPIPTALIRLATWQAGRYGLSEQLLSPGDMKPRLARTVVQEMLRTIEPALREAGELDRVAEDVDWLFQRGTGAARQRAIFAKTGRLSDVVAHLARVTAGQEE